MTIKDVERLTGLTAKSIRYYESKNLIAVSRNEDNSYRTYTEEDVSRLRWIKMFRYLDFSIEEIGQLLDMNEEKIKDSLRQKAKSFSEQKNQCSDKQTLCLSLAKDYKKENGIVEEYMDTIDFLESDEMSELMEQIEDGTAPNLVSTIAQTLILFMAPVFWLFYNIKIERIDLLMVNGIAAVFGTALTTWIWIHYVNQYRKNRTRIKKKNRKMIWMVPAMILSIILGLGALILIIELISGWLIPKDYLFMEQGPVTGVILIWLIMIPAILFCILIIRIISKQSTRELEDVNDILLFWNHLGKWRPVVILAWLIAMYCCVTNFTAVTSDQIICYSPTHPLGIAYNYSDVTSIKAGFGDKHFAIADYKKKGWKNCDFDKEYVDRFLRIIELK